jgi:hypothetical protein
MPPPSDTKPTLHCFVAKDIGNGRFTRPLRVSLDTAHDYLQQGQGWMVIGPDPEDEHKLAEWYRRHDDGA